MKRIQPKAPAFTLVEVLVMACLVVVLFLVIPAAAPGIKAKNARIQCVENLKAVGLAYRTFGVDGKPGNAVTDDIVTFVSKWTNEITSPKVFYCPSDKSRTFTTNWAQLSSRNISYFFNLNPAEASPFSVLVGDSDLLVYGLPLASGINVILTNATVSWSGVRHGANSAVVMGDGSVQHLGLPRLREAMANRGTNELILLAP